LRIIVTPFHSEFLMNKLVTALKEELGWFLNVGYIWYPYFSGGKTPPGTYAKVNNWNAIITP